jgi:hypothetical protein
MRWLGKNSFTAHLKGANMEFSTTQPKISAIARQPVLKKSAFVAALAIFGVFNTLAGIISLVTAIILISNASMPSLASTLLTDTAYKLSLGTLIIASSRAFVKGRLLSIWLYAGSILLDSLYNLLTGYPLNYVFIGFGLLLIWQILKFKNELDLT